MKFIKHLLLTDRFLLRGHLQTAGRRLTTFLNSTPKAFVEMEEVTLTDHVRGQQTRAGKTLVRVEEILLACELEASGDEHMRALSSREKDEISLVLQFGGAAPFRISGMVSRRAIERDLSGKHDFVVVTDPAIKGFPESNEFATWADLPYVIVNRNRLTVVIQ